MKWLLQQSLDEVLAKQKIYEQAQEAISNRTGFKNFTDTFFWEAFRTYAADVPNSYCSRLINRERVKHVFTGHDLGPKEIDIKKAQLRRDGAEIIVQELRATFSRSARRPLTRKYAY